MQVSHVAINLAGALQSKNIYIWAAAGLKDACEVHHALCCHEHAVLMEIFLHGRPFKQRHSIWCQNNRQQAYAS